MIAILMIFAASFALCMIFGKKLYEALPPAAFTVTLGVYLIALILPLRTAVYMCIGAIALLLVFAVLYRRKVGMNSLSRTDIDIYSAIPLCILAVVSVVFCVLFCNRRVFFYDDLSYWALYTKNIFSIGKLPHLFENCSIDYKDYTPALQILQYMAMFGSRYFSEPVMFQTNVCYIYIMLLPVLSTLCDKDAGRFARISSVIFYVIFPHILTAQFYYRLGVDLLLAVTFGYVLYCIIDIRSTVHDQPAFVFRIVCIATGLAFLALIKSSGIVLCLLAIIFNIISEAASGEKNGSGSRPKIIGTAVITVVTLGSYLSWQLFLHYSWNNGYLSNRVKDGVKGEGFALPSYTGEVILNYVNHFFFYPLTRNRLGVTAFGLVVFIAAVYVFIVIYGKRSGNNTGVYTAFFAASMVGLVIFCVAHISMYLFVFDEWEAHGLMEYDRYITQYLGGVFYVFVCLLHKAGLFALKNDSGEVSTGGSKGAGWLAGISLAAFIILLPYEDMSTYLVPGNYEINYESNYAGVSRSAAEEWRASGIREMNLAHDGTQRLTVIANAWDETTQFFEYEAVPQPIDRILNVPAVEEGELVGFIYDYMDNYMYVAKGAKAAYAGNWEETAEVTEGNIPLREGTLYRVNRLNDVKTLTPVYQNIGDFSY